MGKVFNILISELSEKLTKDMYREIEKTQAAKVATAHRARAHWAKNTPVDTGQMKSAWVVENTFNEDDRAVVRVWNRAPHAGIVEAGARKHSVSAAGRESLLRWAMRQRGLDEAEARKFVEAYCWKLLHHGQKGKRIVKDSLKQVRGWLKEETERRMKAKS